MRMRALLSLSGGTLLSRVLGLVRDLLLARLFGADAATDAFFVAFRLPNLLRRLFAEGAFALAVVPALAARRTAAGPVAARVLYATLTGTLGILLFAMTVLGLLGAPLLIALVAPGFHAAPAQQALACDLLRLMLPYLFFVGLIALDGAALNAYGRFGIPALTPVLLNVTLIICALWLAPELEPPVRALAWGVLLAGVVQWMWQLPWLAQQGLLSWPRCAWRDPEIRRLLALLGPTLLGASVIQINLMLDALFASWLPTGSVSWLYYAERLVDFPLGVLGVALGTLIAPALASAHAADDAETFAATLHWAARWLLLLGVPATVGLLSLAQPLVATLFGAGQFAAADIAACSAALMAYTLGLPAFLALKILAPAFYGRWDARTPLRLGLKAIACNVVFDVALMAPLGHAGLALGTACAAAFQVGWLLRAGAFAFTPQLGWLGRRALLASVIMGLGLSGLAPPAAAWLAFDTLQASARLGGLVVGGAALYLSALWLMGVRPRDVLHG